MNAIGILLQKRKKEEEEFEEKISEQLERFFNNNVEPLKNVIDYRYEICRILGHTGKKHYTAVLHFFITFLFVYCDATA